MSSYIADFRMCRPPVAEYIRAALAASWTQMGAAGAMLQRTFPSQGDAEAWYSQFTEEMKRTFPDAFFLFYPAMA